MNGDAMVVLIGLGLFLFVVLARVLHLRHVKRHTLSVLRDRGMAKGDTVRIRGQILEVTHVSDSTIRVKALGSEEERKERPPSARPTRG